MRKSLNMAACLCLAAVMVFSAYLIVNDDVSEEVQATYAHKDGLIYYMVSYGTEQYAVVNGVSDPSLTEFTVSPL